MLLYRVMAHERPYQIALMQRVFWYPLFARMPLNLWGYFILWMVIAALMSVNLMWADQATLEHSVQEHVVRRLVLAVIASFVIAGGLKITWLFEQDVSVIANQLPYTPDDLQPFTRMASLVMYLGGVLLGIAIGISIDGLARFFALWATSSLFISSILVFILGPVFVTQYAALLRVTAWQMTNARKVAINFYDMEAIERFSSPLIRMAILILIGFSFGPSMMIFGEGGIGRTLTMLSCLLTVLAIPPMIRPTLLLRAKTMIAKDAALHALQQYYRGDKSAITTTDLFKLEPEPALADVMAFEHRVKETWDIPVAQTYRKWLALGVLPPLTWILAGGLENLLFD